ncbi:MAG: DUF87 domain-containing protein [Prevotella sp.]|jgi:hypothetical protein|nr:DUF87 domain-containing protein [Prevotella sp.]
MEVALDNIRQAENISNDLLSLKDKLEERINLSYVIGKEKKVILNGNKVMRIALLVGLSLSDHRDLNNTDKIRLSTSSIRIPSSFFTYDNLRSLFSALLKFRYHGLQVDWQENALVSRIIAQEMYRGRNYLMQKGNIDKYLLWITSRKKLGGSIPKLQLIIGDYGDDMPAELDINGKDVNNAQILIAGATGSGKSNLLAVLIQQLRSLSIETAYPVNFLLFDYKGEFSDPNNRKWLSYFDVDSSCILDPMRKPLPFSPFKNLTGATQNQVNLYSTEIASALCAIGKASIGAKMNSRLSTAIINTYSETKGMPISFDLILENYRSLLDDEGKEDSITAILTELERSHLFEKEDEVNLVNECFIIKLDEFPKDGAIAKAIVYFVISKLNIIYENLQVQAKNDECVQIRHFTIIDEAHYMLDFDNRPLRNLIAVGRNKGMSIILATQNMAGFQSKYFDFYANAQYPLIMKQQTISDPVIKDLFGVSGKELQDIRSAISNLQLGELIIKNNDLTGLGVKGKKYKIIKVSHLI